jgi:ectoine hydroxylase-related dioxygenase (phytanoyl-CoA dioxygenase family)
VYLREGTENLLSAWIPLGDCPVNRGGLTYLERSHKHFEARDKLEGGTLRAEHITYDLPALANQLETRWLIADYQAGDMVVHSPYLVHASLNNTDPDGRMRLSTDIRYQRKVDPIDARWQNHWRDDDGL